MFGTSVKKATGRSWSVRSYLVALALCCTVPVAAVTGLLALHLVRDAVERQRSDVENRLFLLRDGVDQRIETIIRVLQAMATARSLQRGDFAAFGASASRTAKLLGVLTIVLADRDGGQLVNTRAPAGGRIPPRAHLEAQERVLATGEPQVSNLYYATIDQRPVISVEVPVSFEGEIRYVLTAGIEPQYLSALMRDFVPAGFIGSIIDRNGLVVARQGMPNDADLIGKPTIPEVRAHLGEPEALWIEAISRTGVPTFTSMLRSQKTGWTISVAVPRSVVQGPIRRVMLFVVAIAIIALVCGLLLARLLAGRLATSANVLEDAAKRIGSEQEVVPALTQVREYDRALMAFGDASRTLKLRAVERDRAESAVRESELRWRSIAESLPNLVWTCLPDGQCDWLSSQWGKYTGIPEQELLGLGWLERVIHPDDRERTLECWKAACEDRGEYDLEYRIRRHDRAYRWFKTRGVPLRDQSGRITYWFGTCTDIEDIRSAETREQLLMGEVNHRAKNMLALVQAIARQTAFNSPREFIAAFDARLQALAASQDLLVRSGWREIPIDELIRTQLAHFADALDTRISLAGPPLKLTAAAAQTFGIIFHELSTNSSKYGALSNNDGKVAIRWEIGALNAGGDAKFHIRWCESEGPPVVDTPRRGFGSTVLDSFAQMSLKANVTLEYPADGFAWRLWCPVSEVVEGGKLSVDLPPAAAPFRSAAISSQRARILVVEDEALPALEVVSLLAEADLEAIGPARSNEQAFRLLEQHCGCDAALLDVNLGPETSEPVARKLCADAIPFIAMSGYSREQLPDIFAAAPFVAKPLRRDLLVEAIHRCLTHKPEVSRPNARDSAQARPVTIPA